VTIAECVLQQEDPKSMGVVYITSVGGIVVERKKEAVIEMDVI
jgi:hypothetical protein